MSKDALISEVEKNVKTLNNEKQNLRQTIEEMRNGTAKIHKNIKNIKISFMEIRNIYGDYKKQQNLLINEVGCKVQEMSMKNVRLKEKLGENILEVVILYSFNCLMTVF